MPKSTKTMSEMSLAELQRARRRILKAVREIEKASGMQVDSIRAGAGELNMDLMRELLREGRR